MRISISGRACGKTTKAIEWLLNDSRRRLAVFSEREKHRIVDLIRGYKHQMDRKDIEKLVIVWNRSTSADQANSDIEIGVDNADWIIQEYFKNPVRRIWMTGEYETMPLPQFGGKEE